MVEEEGDLFSPPKGTCAVCIPVSCELEEKAAVMTRGYGALAKKRWPGIDRVIGYYSTLVGTRVHILTWSEWDPEKGKEVIYFQGDTTRAQPVPYHVLTFPTRSKWKDPPNVDLIIKSARELVHLVEAKEKLKAGRIALPRVGNLGSKGGPKETKYTWASISKQLAIYLESDNFVVLRGANKGIPT